MNSILVYNVHRFIQSPMLRLSTKNPRGFLQCSRCLATIPTIGRPDFQILGQCNVEGDATVFPRRVPLASTIRLANLTARDLAQEFLAYFQSKQHTVVAPSSVFPKRDEGSYFVNAGMNQFKPLFLNQTDSSTSVHFHKLRRATNVQPCIRIGGRLDDLNDVGYDRQHHTMFNMLGSWSFGDYGKFEACQFMWEFATKVLGLPANALYISYFGGDSTLGLPPDDETRDIWLNLGVMDQKLLPFGVDHNFWRAGQSSGAGLCGPSTEVHVDFRALSDLDGLQCARCQINTNYPQVIELWNSVFITHRIRPSPDGGCVDQLELLDKMYVDTGMGLERLACVMQGVTSTYDSDMFLPYMDLIREKASTSSWTPPEYSSEFMPIRNDQGDVISPQHGDLMDTHLTTRLSNLLQNLLSLRRPSKPLCSTDQTMQPSSAASFDDEEVIRRWHRDTAYRLLSDHSRALAHALADGLLPGRQGLGLKLRQLIQRACRAALLTGLDHENSASTAHSTLAYLVAHVAESEQLLTPSDYPMLQGPNARQPSCLSSVEMVNVIDQEVKAFIPRFHSLEEAFERCLENMPGITRLSDENVHSLMRGNYGASVSWDMLCAQSQWAGLASPPPSAMSTDLNPPNISGRPPKRHQQPIGLVQKFRDARVPYTIDGDKYATQRHMSTTTSSIAASYVVPVCESKLLGLITGDNFFPISPTSDTVEAGKIGFLVDRTNFFTAQGGQDCDVGKVEFGSFILDINAVELVEDPKADHACGWIIHWSNLTPNQLTEFKQLPLIDRVTLKVDNVNRFNLTQHHTGQHLFVWALDELVKNLAGDGQTQSTVAFQHHGGSVHASNFTVDAAIIYPPSATDLVHIVSQVEQFCRGVISENLSVVSEKLDWDLVAKDRQIRRFPWVNYPNTVTAIRIGCNQPDISNPIPVSIGTAELCGGTHLHSVGDLLDLTVTAVRSREHTVKQFTGVVGETAKTARIRGQTLVEQATDRIARSEFSNVNESIDWLQNILNHSNPSHTNTHILPFVARERLEQCLRQLKKMRATGCKPTTSEVESMEICVRQLLANSNAQLVLSPMEFDKPDVVVAALVRCNPSVSVIIYSSSKAVFYSPNTSIDTSSALNRAHVIAKQLSPSGNLIKARPLRSTSLTSSDRHKFALFQISHSGPSFDWEQLTSLADKCPHLI